MRVLRCMEVCLSSVHLACSAMQQGNAAKDNFAARHLLPTDSAMQQANHGAGAIALAFMPTCPSAARDAASS